MLEWLQQIFSVSEIFKKSHYGKLGNLFQSLQTDSSGQIVQTQVRHFSEKRSDKGLYYLQFHQYLLVKWL